MMIRDTTVHVSAHMAALFMLFACATAGSSFADDGAGYLGDPKLTVSCGNVKLRASSAYVVLNEDIMDIAYEFMNTCKGNAVTVRIDVPPYAWFGAGNNYPDRSYADLKLTINGKDAVYTKSQKAYYKNTDITTELAKYNILPHDIADLDKWTVNMTDETMRYYRPLAKKGYLSGSFPGWKVKTTYTYNLEPVEGETISLGYAYTALPGYDYYGKSVEDIYPLQRMNLEWGDMVAAYGKKERHYVIAWIDIPLHADENMGIDNLTVDIRERKGGVYMTALKKDGVIAFYRGTAHISLKNFRQQCLPVVMFAPLN